MNKGPLFKSVNNSTAVREQSCLPERAAPVQLRSLAPLSQLCSSASASSASNGSADRQEGPFPLSDAIMSALPLLVSTSVMRRRERRLCFLSQRVSLTSSYLQVKSGFLVILDPVSLCNPKVDLVGLFTAHVCTHTHVCTQTRTRVAHLYCHCPNKPDASRLP